MKFARDILLIDFQTTGINIEKDFPLQLAAVLLDKDNLLEKKSYSSYIRHPFSQENNDRIVQNLGITKETWMASPNLKTVIAEFEAKFAYNVTLASQNIINVNFLKECFRRTAKEYEYDYHIIELWSLGYLYLSKQNLKKIPTATTLGTYFKIQKEDERDALANCRYLAEILRKLVALY